MYPELEIRKILNLVIFHFRNRNCIRNIFVRKMLFFCWQNMSTTKIKVAIFHQLTWIYILESGQFQAYECIAGFLEWLKPSPVGLVFINWRQWYLLIQNHPPEVRCPNRKCEHLNRKWDSWILNGLELKIRKRIVSYTVWVGWPTNGYTRVLNAKKSKFEEWD